VIVVSNASPLISLTKVGCLHLAQELGADLAIIDERAARLLAAQHAVKVIGCVGLLETGHQQGRLTELRETYQQLLSQGAHIDRQILNRSLAALNLPSL